MGGLDKRAKIIERFYEKKAAPSQYREPNIKIEKYKYSEAISIEFRDKNDNIFSIYVDFVDNVVVKKMGNARAWFDNEELRFFDSLGFQIHSAAAEYTKQNIEDWWIKG